MSLSSRNIILFELLGIGVFAGVYLLVFPGRPRYLDAVFGLLAVVLIGLDYRRSRRLWQQLSFGTFDYRCQIQPEGAAWATSQQLPFGTLDYRARLRAAFGWVMLFTIPVTMLFFVVALGIGLADGGWPAAAQRLFNWHLLPALVLYVAWGLLQQFVFQFYLLGRLLCLLPPRFAIPVLALIFSAVHFPRVTVMAAVFIAALVWGTIYRRYRTVLPLAISHAMLASTLHYWIFGHDLWAAWVLRG